jgi:anti-sigma factor RsiW
MDCLHTVPSLSPYLDQALPPAERQTVESHLSTCAECRRRLQSLRALKHAVGRLAGHAEPPAAVRAHVEALRLGQRQAHGLRYAVAAAVGAAALAAAVVVGLVLRRDNPDVRLAEELVADHLHSVPEVRPAEIASGERLEIVRFFTGHVPFAPVVPEMPGAHLLGARLCRIDGRRVELLFYQQEGRTLSLFVTDRPLDADACWAARGHHVCSRSKGGLTLLLVGELPAEALRRLLAVSAS